MVCTLELDHVVIFANVDAPEAQSLELLGLTGYGGTTRHGELGTASTSFFFSNTYLELFWVCDVAAATRVFAPLDFDMQGRMRWRETTASPFGVMLRHGPDSTGPLPFPTHTLKADWMPGDVVLEFSAATAEEPYVGVVPASLAYPAFISNTQPLQLRLGIERLTGVHIAVASASLSPVAQMLSANHLATIEPANAPLMTLTFDSGRQHKMVDVRPTLPLRLEF